eukprot:2637184-Amphidinium_carterae.1
MQHFITLVFPIASLGARIRSVLFVLNLSSSSSTVLENVVEHIEAIAQSLRDELAQSTADADVKL